VSEQKFHLGDLVRITDDLGHSMEHFPGAGGKAIVMGSYADQFGGNNVDSYTLFIEDRGRVSWYHGYQLTMIKEGQLELLKKWKLEEEMEIKLHSDLDWIFKNGEYLLNEKSTGASVQALASCFGLNDLWGARGEGIEYYANTYATMNLAAPFLKSGDKEGWLKFCDGLKKRDIMHTCKHEEVRNEKD
jgi:hypothetical protein